MPIGGAVFSVPTMPTTGVGKIGVPSVSLYRLTLPPVTGTSKMRQASAKSFDGLDDLGHDLRPLRIAEVQVVRRRDGKRANCGQITAALRNDQALFPRGDRARSTGRFHRATSPLMFLVSLMRTIAASDPGPATVFVRT